MMLRSTQHCKSPDASQYKHSSNRLLDIKVLSGPQEHLDATVYQTVKTSRPNKTVEQFTVIIVLSSSRLGETQEIYIHFLILEILCGYDITHCVGQVLAVQSQT